MPVRVNIPIRLRVDPEALLERQADIEEALAMTVSRALANSRDVVLEPRGGYVGVNIHTPEFAWIGAGVSQVSEDTQTTLEEKITSTLLLLLESSGIYDWAQEMDNPDQLSVINQVEEPIDRERYAALLRRYIVPSYDQRGEHKAVEVINSKEEKSLPSSSQIKPRFLSLYGQDVAQVFENELYLARRTLPNSGYLGAIFWSRKHNKIAIGIWRFPAGRPVIGVPLIDLIGGEPRLEFDPKSKKETLVFDPVDLSPSSAYRISNVQKGSTPEERRKVLTEHWRPVVEKYVQENSSPIPATMKATEYRTARQAKIGQQTAELVESQLKKLPKETTNFCTLEVGTISFLIHSEIQLPTDLDSELIPLVEYKPVSEESVGSGDSATSVGGTGTDEFNDVSGDGNKKITQIGGFVYTGQDKKIKEEEIEAFFPSAKRGYEQLLCEPFLDEPPLETLGDDGQEIYRDIQEIAFKLQIPICNFAGKFCLNAAATLGARAIAVSSYSVNEGRFTQQIEANTGNLGSLNFVPSASPALQFMRHLAGVIPLIGNLSRFVARRYRQANTLQGDWQDNSAGWLLRFYIELSDLMKDSVGVLFGMTCQILMLQLLRTSRKAIDSRLQYFEAYAPLFEQLVRVQLEDINELLQLRERLKTFKQQVQARDITRQMDVMPAGVLAVPGANWLNTARLITEALVAWDLSSRDKGEAGEIVQKEGITQIRDSKGTLWTLFDLEEAIAIRRGNAEAIDPLIKQITDIPDLMQRLRVARYFGIERKAIRFELRRILEEMHDNNEDITHKVEGSWVYAFRISKIQEDLPSATIPGTFYALQGIHRLAHEELGEFARGDSFYNNGVNFIFGAELGRTKLIEFLTFSGLIHLSICCPPLAFVAGVLDAIRQYDAASEQEQIYNALIDPEQVIRRAEVEAELFAAQLGLALAFIPKARSILRLGSYGGKAIARAGIVRGSRIIRRHISRRITREMAEQLSKELITVFVREITTDLVMDKVMQLVLEPVIQHIEREATITGPVGGTQGALQVRQRLQAERQSTLSNSPNPAMPPQLTEESQPQEGQ
jgi:hypothetical protein